MLLISRQSFDGLGLQNLALDEGRKVVVSILVGLQDALIKVFVNICLDPAGFCAGIEG
jgi:hypothetical protein